MILKSTALLSVKGFSSLDDAIKYHEAEDLPIEPYIHHFPVLPERYNRTIKINSQVYLNLFHYKCNCIKFLVGCDHYEERDIRIACHHFEKALLQSAWNEIDALTKKILRNQLKAGPEKLFKLDEETILATRPQAEWIRIYILVEGKWNQFYYSRKKERFSHGIKPKNWEEIIKIIMREQ